NYTYFNKGKEEVVDFAFPVEFLVDLFDSRDNPTEKDLIVFNIKKDGKEVQYDHIIERKYCFVAVPELSLNNSQCDRKMTRRWYVTKIEFQTQKETHISINYKIQTDGGASNANVQAIPTIGGGRSISYDFSPAQYFGSGKAEKIEIVLNLEKVEYAGGKLIEINPQILKETGKGVYSYSGKDFDFKKNSNLSIKYDVDELEMFNYFKKNRKTNNYPAIPYHAVSSSIDAKHGVQNLFDGDADTSWCFKGGQEQFVEIELLPTLPLRYISILNGDLKNKQTYEENGKVTELEVTTDCTDKDSCIYCSIYEFEKNYKPDIPDWNDVFMGNPFFANREIWRIKESDYLLKKPCRVKILIKGTTKGKKSDNVCISEIFLM
ncbi:MAG TPA: hypothetical protein PLZ43_13260, partial [bacterium]|nr:hypothetical protein [bacterium]